MKEPARFAAFLLEDWLLETDKTIILQHAEVAPITNTASGALGSALVPSIARRLRAQQLIG